jgi:hypothetical protein
MRHQVIGTMLALSTNAVIGAALAASTAAAECRDVTGHQQETPLVGQTCASPVGLCTIAEMSGVLKGDAVFTASAILPSADTSLTGVVFVIGDTVIANAHLGGKRGTLLVKNAAAFNTGASGDLADVQTIVGGTGDLAGASGNLRISGTFVAGAGGTSVYDGVVCVP